MLDRFLKLLVILTLLMFLLQAVIGVLGRVLEEALASLVSTLMHGSSFLMGPVAVVGALCVFTGLIIRLSHFVISRDPRSAREQASRERAMRQRVRRPAEGVPPADDRRDELPDPDPAVGEAESRR